MKRGERLQAIRDHITQNPGCTCRDVARDVFGGTGNTRTTQRNQAQGYLRMLEDMGHIRRVRPTDNYSRRKADLWHPA